MVVASACQTGVKSDDSKNGSPLLSGSFRVIGSEAAIAGINAIAADNKSMHIVKIIAAINFGKFTAISLSMVQARPLSVTDPRPRSPLHQ